MKIFKDTVSWRNLVTAKTISRWPDEIVLLGAEDLGAIEGVPPSHCIAVTDKMSSTDMVALVKNTGVSHILQTTHPRFDHAVNLACSMIHTPIEIMNSPVEHFFAQRNVQPSQVKIEVFPIVFSKDRQATLKELSAYLETIDRTRTIRTSVISIADELFTNALYNAPTDKAKNKLYEKIERTTPVTMDPAHQARLVIASDDHVLLIYSEDSYGSIVPETVIDRLDQCHKHGVESIINFNNGGAGIGCYMMMAQTNSFLLSVQPGVKSVVGGILLLGLPARLVVSIPKNLHMIRMGQT